MAVAIQASGDQKQPYNAYDRIRRVDKVNTQKQVDNLAAIADDPAGYARREATVEQLRRVAADPTRKVQTATKASQNPGYNTVSDDFNTSYQQAGLAGGRGSAQTLDRTSRVQTDYVQAPVQTGMVAPMTKTQKRRKKIRKTLGAKAMLARARATAINLWVWGTGFFATIWLLVFALLSAAGMAMWMAIENYYNNLTTNDAGQVTIGGKILNTVGEFAVNVFTLLNEISKFLFSIDLSVFNPLHLFFAAWLIAVFIALLQLFLTWFMYTASFLKPLSGQAAGAKLGLFVCCIVFLLPFAIIFWPLFFFGWTAVIWLYPK